MPPIQYLGFLRRPVRKVGRFWSRIWSRLPETESVPDVNVTHSIRAALAAAMNEI